MAKIDMLLFEMVANKASDLHLTTGFRPYCRLHGDMQQIEHADALTAESNAALLAEIMPEGNRKQLEQEWDTDFAYEVKGIGRFRVNAFMDRFGPGAVLRMIPTKIPSADDLGLPRGVRDFCLLSKGLVLVTGPTGSGKSTTLAAMIDLINRVRTDHIITIEDPIEFVHQPKKCLINQREVHTHTKSFPNALRAALREDPDIVLVGEMRDLETIEIALETAETGHLVFGTLHTNTAYTAVDRMIDKFPSDRQNQIRTMLAESLKGVVAQNLCKKIGGGRVAALEILVINNAVSSMIRDGKTHAIPSAMQIGKNIGMQMFNDSFMELVNRGLVEPKEAFLKCVDKDGLMQKFQSAGIVLDKASLLGEGAPPAAPGVAAQEVEQMLAAAQRQLQADPNDIDALNNVAWVMSTTIHDRLRNGKEALRFAEKAYALTKGRHPAVLDTLSAAYAECGQFDRAIDAARRGLELARSSNEAKLVDSLQQLMTLYQKGQPVRA